MTAQNDAEDLYCRLVALFARRVSDEAMVAEIQRAMDEVRKEVLDDAVADVQGWLISECRFNHVLAQKIADRITKFSSPKTPQGPAGSPGE